MRNLIYNGKINLILGCMYSGKTSELLRRYQRHTFGGKKCLMIKYKNDTRYDKENMVVTHDGIKIQGIICEFLYEANKYVINYNVICIDEIQFYKDAHIFCDIWANFGIIIEACGLSGTFNRTQFPIISKLIPLAENITFLKAVCKDTGDDATYTNIISIPSDNINIDISNNELIGGIEKYNAVDRKTYFNNNQKNKNYILNIIREFLDIYTKNKIVEINYSDKKLNRILDNIYNETFKFDELMEFIEKN